jgi:hypothetical protein
MADREKVLAGLRACREWSQEENDCMADGCPYLVEPTTDDDESWMLCLKRLHQDTMELIESMEREEDDGK